MFFNNAPMEITFVVVILIISYLLFKIIDKLKNDKLKLLIIKIDLTLALTFLLILICVMIYLKFNNISPIYLEIILLLLFIFSLTGIFLFIFGNIIPPKPNKYLLKQDNYIDFSNYLNKRLLLNNYQEVYSEENLKIYKKIIKKNKHYIIDFKTEEFTEDIYNDLYDNKMIPIMEKDLKEMQNKMYRSLYVTYIISVDRLTSYFNHFIKGLDQDIRYFSLPVGISFGGNKIYIASEIEGFEMMELKRMKKEIKIILELENKENKA